MKIFRLKRFAVFFALVIGGCLLSFMSEPILVRGGSMAAPPIQTYGILPKDEEASAESNESEGDTDSAIVWSQDEDDSDQSDGGEEDNSYYDDYDDGDDDDDYSNYSYYSSDYEYDYSYEEAEPAEDYSQIAGQEEAEGSGQAYYVENVGEESYAEPALDNASWAVSDSQQSSSGNASPAAADRSSSLTMANAMNLKPTVLIDAPYINQQGSWATGCESVSATMLLSFLGVGLTVDQFIYGFLDIKPVYVGAGGQIYAPNPSMYFAGNPYTESSYGCYAPVIQRALRRALDASQTNAQQNYEVVDLTGVSMEEICRDYLDQGFPVVFWATIGMVPSTMGPTWIVPDTGEKFTWLEQEHCLLLVGYDDINYYFNDPYNNRGLIGYEKSLTEHRHKEQYSMAVGVRASGQ